MRETLIRVGVIALVLGASAGLCFLFPPKYDPKAVAEDRRSNAQSFQSHVGDLVYGRDARTGVCFTGSGLGTQFGVLAAVPCTPTVLAEIAK